VEKNIVLECGCEYEVINNKGFWFYCEEHDVDAALSTEKPVLKKYRKSIEDYV
jgi:hypothetical protein